jgi:hypothetical protein
MHGRICQIAALGMIAPSLFGTFPGSEWTGSDAYSNTNPIVATTQVALLAVVQIIAFMSFLEVKRIGIILEEGSAYMPGDSRFGQVPMPYAATVPHITMTSLTHETVNASNESSPPHSCDISYKNGIAVSFADYHPSQTHSAIHDRLDRPPRQDIFLYLFVVC